MRVKRLTKKFWTCLIHSDSAIVFLGKTCKPGGLHYNGSCDLDIYYRQAVFCGVFATAFLRDNLMCRVCNGSKDGRVYQEKLSSGAKPRRSGSEQASRPLPLLYGNVISKQVTSHQRRKSKRDTYVLSSPDLPDGVSVLIDFTMSAIYYKDHPLMHDVFPHQQCQLPSPVTQSTYSIRPPIPTFQSCHF